MRERPRMLQQEPCPDVSKAQKDRDPPRRITAHET